MRIGKVFKITLIEDSRFVPIDCLYINIFNKIKQVFDLGDKGVIIEEIQEIRLIYWHCDGTYQLRVNLFFSLNRKIKKSEIYKFINVIEAQPIKGL